uniref:Putative secreted protein n=1 Tax=Ixodes ricinus TaxID=34613 RepID=A0A6B0U7W7_IXORI
MYRNISIIVLVFFAVVLGLPESQGGGSDIDLLECYRAVSEGEKIFCELSGYDVSLANNQKQIYFLIIQRVLLFFYTAKTN